MDIKLQPNITGTNVNLVRGATQADLTNAVNNSKTYRDESEAFSLVSESKSIVATDSANSASSSATTASNAANTATTKANEANSSAISASASETVCIDKATIATDKADIAIAQAVIATNKASEASTDADTATTQAGISTTKASEASTSASNALTSANNADISEANALTYRNEAESFANSVNSSNIVHITGTETITGDKTFSGTVSGLTSSTVGLGNVANESKDTMFTSPTFTGTVTLPSTTSIGTTSSTELGYVDGVTSSIQTQLDNKVSKVTSTDNAIVRFNGTTGAVQNSGVTIDDNGNVGIGTTLDNNTRRIGFTTGSGGSSAIESVTQGSTNQYLVFKTTYVTESEKLRITGQGNVLVTGGGGLGYGAGSGGAVTQLTSKSTAVTLNKPTGAITMNNAALAAGASARFLVLNNLVNILDTVLWSFKDTTITDQSYNVWISSTSGGFYVNIKNISAGNLSEALVINFTVIKGAAS